MTLPEDFVAQVVEHMNSDHKDSLREYATAYGGVSKVVAVTMKDISTTTITLECDLGAEMQIIEIPLINRIERPAQIRGVLVAMAKQARARNKV